MITKFKPGTNLTILTILILKHNKFNDMVLITDITIYPELNQKILETLEEASMIFVRQNPTMGCEKELKESIHKALNIIRINCGTTYTEKDFGLIVRTCYAYVSYIENVRNTDKNTIAKCRDILAEISNYYHTKYNIPNRTLVHNIINRQISYINECIEHFDMYVIHKIGELSERIIEKAENKQNIYLIGVGKNVPMMQKAAATMRSLSIKAVVIDTVEVLHGDMGMFDKSDLVICCSKSGKTSELVTTMLKMKEYNMDNVWMLTMGKLEDFAKYLCKLNNHIILPKCAETDNFNKVPSVSPIVFQIVFDAIAFNVSNYFNFSSVDFLHNHPGGTIGKSLSESSETAISIL